MANVNVLRPRVLDVIATQSNGTTIITIQGNLVEVKAIVNSKLEDLGQDGHKVMFYHFLKLGYDLDNGVEPLACDNDVVLLGQSSGKDLEGQSSEKDLEGKSSAVGNDGSSQVPSQFVNDFYSSYDPYEESQDPNFDPFADLDLILPTDRNREERQSEEETKVEDKIDSEDSDYLVDEDNNVDDVDVDMEDFEYNIDEEVEFVGCRDREQEPDIEEGDDKEIEVLDNDYFKSASDSDDEASKLRKRKLKQIRKQ
nr:hypothetical protein [Tanacetum cinerariifolium]